MKLGLVTKLDKSNTVTSKKMIMTSRRQIVTSLYFFQFMVTLQPSRSGILDLQSIKRTFSLIVTFYLTKPENRTKKSLIQLALILLL